MNIGSIIITIFIVSLVVLFILLIIFATIWKLKQENSLDDATYRQEWRFFPRRRRRRSSLHVQHNPIAFAPPLHQESHYNPNLTARYHSESHSVGTLPLINYRTRRSEYAANNQRTQSFTAPYPTVPSHPLAQPIRLAPYPTEPSHPLPQTSICVPSSAAPYPTQPSHPLPQPLLENDTLANLDSTPFVTANIGLGFTEAQNNFNNSASCSNDSPPSYTDAMAAQRTIEYKRTQLQNTNSFYDNR